VQGFGVVAVLIPSEIQVDPERWTAGLASLSLDAEEYDPEVPTSIFVELLDRHSIPTLDLGPVFAQGLDAGENLYYRLDRHWTNQGHELAAETMESFLAPKLKEEGPPDADKVAASEGPRD